MTPRRSFVLLSALFFSSGATSLVFEVLWLRGFAIVLGGTVYSLSCVLTAFMAGLALGASAATRWIERNRHRPRADFVRLYGWLELGIGLYGLGITAALFLGQGTWLALLGRFHDAGPATTLLAHFAFSLAALLAPTLGMGATLPLLVMSLERERDEVALYGMNTFGAATGSLVASFVLIYLLGVLGAAAVVAAVNVGIFAAALAFSRRVTGTPDQRVVEEAAAPPSTVTWSPGLLLLLSFFSGFLFFAFELVWNRALSIVLGNRVYVTSLTLSIVLVCLGVGARLSRRWLRRWRPEVVLVGSYLAAAAFLCVGLLAETALYTNALGPFLLFLLAGIPLPAVALGVVFPLLLSLPAQGVARGTHVGRLYAVNTLGSMGGSLLTGYVLFGALGSNRILLLGVAVLLGSTALLARGAVRVPRALAAGLAVLVAATFATRWSARLSTVPPEATELLDEDAYGLFSIARTREGLLSVRCNSTELVYLFGSEATQFVQESQAHFPLFFAPRRSRVLVVGSGYGITAGAAAQWPGVERVDAVEILPLMVRHAERFAAGNHGYHRDPRVRVHVADGRHFLAAASAPWDVISINVSDPYLPGSASLFSTEFYELVTRRLAPDGVVCQHLFGPDTASLLAGFQRHFRYVKVVRSYGNGISVIGSQAPLALRPGEALSDARLGPVLARVDLGSLAEVERLLADGEEARAALEAEGPAFENSDLRPALEFRRSDQVRLLRSNF